MLRSPALTLVLGLASLIGACDSGDDDSGSGAGAGSGGSSKGGSGASTSGGSGGAAGNAGRSGAASGGTSSGGRGGSTTSCVTETRELQDLILAGAGGQIDFTICDFNVPSGVDDNYINVFVGGTKVCWRASSQGCDPHGFWLNGAQILLCDATCSAYFDPEPDVPVYLEIGCEIDSCL